MPEAAINEDDDSRPNEHYVGFTPTARKQASVDSEPETSSVQSRSKRNLHWGVARRL